MQQLLEMAPGETIEEQMEWANQQADAMYKPYFDALGGLYEQFGMESPWGRGEPEAEPTPEPEPEGECFNGTVTCMSAEQFQICEDSMWSESRDCPTGEPCSEMDMGGLMMEMCMAPE